MKGGKKVKMARVPACPDCGAATKRIRGYYFFCPECKAQFPVPNWDKITATEESQLAESEKLKDISSLIAIYDTSCDECGKIIMPAQKYCYDSSVIIDTVDEMHCPIKRGRRLCVNCSVEKGWLRWVRSKITGQEYPVMLLGEKEEWI